MDSTLYGASNDKETAKTSQNRDALSGTVNVKKLPDYQISVALLIDNGVIDKETNTLKPVMHSVTDVDAMSSLIKRAIGFNGARGDRVEITQAPFIRQRLNNQSINPVTMSKTNQSKLFALIGLCVLTMILFMGFIRKPKQSVNGVKGGEDGFLDETFKVDENDPVTIVKTMASNEPQRVARVVKSWIAGGK